MRRPQGHSEAGGIKSVINPSDPIGNGTRDIPVCSAVPQPTRNRITLIIVLENEILTRYIRVSHALLNSCPWKSNSR